LVPTLKIEVIPVENAKEAIRDADIVACATNSHGCPVVKGEWIESGMHLTSILPTDFDVACWERSEFIITSSPMGPQWRGSYGTENPRLSSFPTEDDGVSVEVDRFQRFNNKIYLLFDVLVGKAPKRTNSSQITMLNKNWGLGIEFASVAKLIYDRAHALGIGKEVPTDWFSQTSHP